MQMETDERITAGVTNNLGGRMMCKGLRCTVMTEHGMDGYLPRAVIAGLAPNNMVMRQIKHCV